MKYNEENALCRGAGFFPILWKRRFPENRGEEEKMPKEKKPLSKGMAWLVLIAGMVAVIAVTFALSRWTSIGRMSQKAQAVFSAIALVGLILVSISRLIRGKPAEKRLEKIGWILDFIGLFVYGICLMTK